MGVTYPQPTPGSSLKTGLRVTRKCVGSLSFISWSGARGDGRTPRALLSSLTLTQTRASLGYQTPVRPPACLDSSLFRCVPKLSSDSKTHRSIVPIITQEVRIAGAMGGFKGNLGQIQEEKSGERLSIGPFMSLNTRRGQ